MADPFSMPQEHTQVKPLSPLHAAALAYAERGIHVFPIAPGTKDRPLTQHGHLDATTDAATITAWWGAHPDANIGWAPALSGHVLVDLDRHGSDGFAALAALETTSAASLPATRTVATANDGEHRIFRGALATATKYAGSAGIDIRGGLLIDGAVKHSGYGLLPPSRIVRDDGTIGEYAWKSTEPAADLPEWFTGLALTAERQAPARAAVAELDLPVNIERARERLHFLVSAGDVAIEGAGGDDRTYRLCAEMLNMGLSPETAAAEISSLWNPHCVPPWDEDEIAVKVGNAWRYAQNEPGSYAASGITESMVAGLVRYAAEHAPAVPPGVRLAKGSERKPMQIEWLWRGHLALGKLEIFGGQKGAGKSTISFDFAATVTAGGKWPDGSQAPLGDVLIWSGEDDFDDTILPRFLASGGDANRVYSVDGVIRADGGKRHFDPATDIPDLLAAARQLPNLKLIIIDPIVSAVSGDSHKNAETRRGLQPLVDFAADCRAALIGITHFTKNTQGRDPIERITGSLAFGALPRCVHAAVKSEDGAARKLIRIASNIGQDGGGFEYLLRQAPVPGYNFVAQRVAWGKQLTGSARELIDASETQSAGLKAIGFLEQTLREAGGSMMVRDLKGAAEANGHAWGTLRRAKEQMGGKVVVKQNLGASHSGWRWDLIDTGSGALPSEPANAPDPW